MPGPIGDEDGVSGALLTEQHIGLVRRVAADVVRRARPYLELDDLIAIGAEVLLRAAADFDPDREVSFASFVYLRLRGAMIDSIGLFAPLPRGVVRRRSYRPDGPCRAMIRLEECQARWPAGHDRVADLAGAIDYHRAALRLDRALAVLEGVEREIITRYYFHGHTLDEIGRDAGRSRSWASRAHHRALARLRAAFHLSPHGGPVA
jgi:RNA polymerase sigma factor (sigma-70 family)